VAGKGGDGGATGKKRKDDLDSVRGPVAGLWGLLSGLEMRAAAGGGERPREGSGRLGRVP